MIERDLEARITQALDASPRIAPPADFAQRVARQAATLQRPASPRASHYGRLAVYLALAACLIAMVVVAPHALGQSPASLTLEFSFAGEFLGLLVFLSLRPKSLR